MIAELLNYIDELEETAYERGYNVGMKLTSGECDEILHRRAWITGFNDGRKYFNLTISRKKTAVARSFNLLD